MAFYDDMTKEQIVAYKEFRKKWEQDHKQDDIENHEWVKKSCKNADAFKSIRDNDNETNMDLYL